MRCKYCEEEIVPGLTIMYEDGACDRWVHKVTGKIYHREPNGLFHEATPMTETEEVKFIMDKYDKTS